MHQDQDSASQKLLFPFVMVCELVQSAGFSVGRITGPGQDNNRSVCSDVTLVMDVCSK